jgi:signal peptidase complex subunit 3
MVPRLPMQARMWIDLSVDLRNEFTWMTKQLFLYVTVDFETPDNRFNQMVMWSHIITSTASGHTTA